MTGSTGRTAPGRIDLADPELDRLEGPSRVPPVPAPPPRRQATPPGAPPTPASTGPDGSDRGPGGPVAPDAAGGRGGVASGRTSGGGPPDGPGPAVARTRAELATALAGLRAGGRRLALVPTMGALHAGHLALVRAAAARADAVVASIFVNPLQFGAGEDLDRYPRTPEADLAALAAEGVDLVFAPSAEEMYPGGPPRVTVDAGPLGELLEGTSRPGHFAGVLTVVTKLVGLLRPDVAVFGEKDYQQLALVRRAVVDLELGVEVVGVPTVREPDGLALSSRNRYLSDVGRARALSLSRALRAGAAAGPGGAGAVLAAATAELADPGLAVDYLALRGVDLGAAPAAGPARLLVAARVGSTRLIDNVPLVLGSA